MTFEAVGKRLDEMVDRLKERWKPYLRGFDGDVDMLAKIARGLQHDAATQCYRDGIEKGTSEERVRLGLPSGDIADDTPTRPVPTCPHCGR
jgi:hypothetical protein